MAPGVGTPGAEPVGRVGFVGCGSGWVGLGWRCLLGGCRSAVEVHVVVVAPHVHLGVLDLGLEREGVVVLVGRRLVLLAGPVPRRRVVVLGVGVEGVLPRVLVGVVVLGMGVVGVVGEGV